MIDEKADIAISSMQNQIKELQNLLTTATNENTALINKNKQLNRILEKIPQPSQSLNSNGKILSVNEKWCEELGYKKEEIIGRQFNDFLTSQTEQTYFKQFPNLKKNGYVSGVEFDMLHKNGNKITVSLDGVIINDDNGQMIYTSCIFSNITEQKKILNTLYDSEEKFRSLYDDSPDMYVSVSPKDSTVLLCNKTFLNKTNFTKDEIIGKSVFDLYHDDALNDAKKAFKQFVTIGSVLDIPLIIKKKDGSKINVDLNVSVVRDINGEILHSISSWRDVTKLKIAQEEIKLLNERVERALWGNNDGIWDLNMIDNSVYFSPKWKEMIGYEDHELPNLYESWKKNVHPEDIDNVIDAMQNHINAKTEFFEAVHRLKHKNNSWIWIQSRGKASYDQDGNSIRMTGTHHDITETKVLEQKLQKSHEKLQRLTENIPGAAYQYRLYPEGNSEFTYVSKGIKNIYEVSPEDALKGSSAILNYTHPDDKEMFDTSVAKTIETMEEWNLEYRVNLPKKGLRWIHGKSTPEKLSDGSILWSGLLEDITEQIIAREKLLTQSKQLEQKKLELERLIQDAPNPMMLHNEDGEILMMNNAWIKSSGFSYEETSTINELVESIYKDSEKRIKIKAHINSLYSITEKVDEGEFSFYDKNGNVLTFNHSSSPLGLINNKRTIISSAIDITELKKKDRLLFEQSKLAAMGEMIGNIAHQWRQPLSVISTGATGMQLQKEYGLLTDEFFDKTCTDINNNAQYLSKTIEDFKNFIRNDRKKVTYNLSENINSFLELVKGSIKNNNINLVLDLNDSITIEGYPNELIQCLINVFNNAKDALVEKKIKDKFIFISTSTKDNEVFIKIKDNAGGISPKVLPKIFEPYFTTKNQSKGTGLGLSMTYNLIVDGMNGSVKANNVSYIYDNKEYLGAEFSIKLPIS